MQLEKFMKPTEVEVALDGKVYIVELSEFAPMGATVYEKLPNGGYVLRDPHGLDVYMNEARRAYHKQNSILYGQAAVDRVALLRRIIAKARAAA